MLLISICALLVCGYLGINAVQVYDLLGPDGIGLPSRMIPYVSRAGHFSFRVPEKWRAVDLPGGNHGDSESRMAVSSPLLSAVHVEVFVRQFPAGDISSVVAWGDEKPRSISGFEALSSQLLRVNERETFVTEYLRPVYSGVVKFAWKSDAYHCINWYVLENDVGYDFSFCSVGSVWDEAEPVFLEMIHSTEFLTATAK